MKNVDDVTSPFEGTWRKPNPRDVAKRPRITWTSTIILIGLSFPPPSFSNIRIISKRLFFYHKNGCTPTLRMITRLQRYIKNPELPSNSGDFCDLFATKQQRAFVSISTMTYCVVQINCLPLPRLFKKVTNHSPHGASHARSLFVLLYAIFYGSCIVFQKKIVPLHRNAR